MVATDRSSIVGTPITPSNGETLRVEILSKLEKTAQNDRWNRSHRKFGANLVIVCSDPRLDDADSSDRPPLQWYIIQALRDFVESQADLLDVEIAWLSEHHEVDRKGRKDQRRPSEWSSDKILDNTRHSIAHRELELGWKSERLRELSETIEVNIAFDGFIVDHHSGAVHMLRGKDDACSGFISEDNRPLPKGGWAFECGTIP